MSIKFDPEILMLSEYSQKIHKPWGSEELIFHTALYATKILTINPGYQLSRQYHVRKTESLMVLSGILEADIGFGKSMRTSILQEGQKIHIEPGTIHRFRNNSNTRLMLIETSTTELDDVIRLEDDFDR